MPQHVHRHFVLKKRYPSRKGAGTRLLRAIPEERSGHFLCPADIEANPLTEYEIKDCTQRLMKVINTDRSAQRLDPFARAPKLDQLAQAHAEKMVCKGKLSHTVKTLNELRQLLYSRDVGSNVQVGPSVHRMHRAALNDRSCEENRANLFSQTFTEIGIGVALCSDSGRWYMCQLFRDGNRKPFENN